MGRKILLAVIGIGAVAIVVAAVVAGRRAPERIASRNSGAKNVSDFQTEDYAIHVASIVSGLSHPWSLAFLPDGDLLITERGGTLRRVHNGVLRRETLDGTPRVHSTDQEGLLDIALHPRFAQNHLLYLTYSKEGPSGTTIALARGRLEGDALVNVKDVFVADNWST